MAHQTLKKLQRQFNVKAERGYGWLESRAPAERTIILIHGVTGGKDDMLPLAVAYEAKGFHVYCLDLPGHGESDWIDEPNFDKLSAWLDGFIKMVGAPDVMVSNSFSSGVVYAYLTRGMLPENTHVILGCPTPDTSRLTQTLYKAGEIIPVNTAWYLYTTWPADALRTSLAAKKPGITSLRWLVESERRKRSTIHPSAFKTLSVQLFIDNPYDAPILDEALQKRITVVLGTRDNVVTRRTASILEQLLPHAKHIKAHKAGHILHFEAVADFPTSLR